MPVPKNSRTIVTAANSGGVMINRSAFAIRRGMRKGFTSRSPIPTRIVANEEFPPPPQTPAQANVEHLTDLYAERAGPKLGNTRRHFLKTTGGMAAALLALNDVFGKFFDVGEAEMFDAAAFVERKGEPFFIFDVQTHYVSESYDPTNAEAGRKGAVAKQGLLALRKMARRAGLNPKQKSTRLNSSHQIISYAVFCLKKKKASAEPLANYSIELAKGVFRDAP